MIIVDALQDSDRNGQQRVRVIADDVRRALASRHEMRTSDRGEGEQHRRDQRAAAHDQGVRGLIAARDVDAVLVDALADAPPTSAGAVPFRHRWIYGKSTVMKYM